MVLSIIAYALLPSAARCSKTPSHTPDLAQRLAILAIMRRQKGRALGWLISGRGLAGTAARRHRRSSIALGAVVRRALLHILRFQAQARRLDHIRLRLSRRRYLD